MDKPAINLKEEPNLSKKTGSVLDKKGNNPFFEKVKVISECIPDVKKIAFDRTQRSIDHTIIFMTEGTMDMEVSLIRFHLVKHSLLLIPANSVIAFNAVSPDCVYRLASFPTFASGQNDLIGYEPLMIEIEEPHLTTIENYFYMMDMLTQNKHSEYAQSVQHIIISMIYHLRKVNEIVLQTKGLIDLPNPQKIKSEFLYMLNQNSCPIRSVTYYTDRLNITPTHLNNVMKKLTGMTTSEWINKTTIRAARELLTDPKNYTVAVIAEKLHCGSEPNFSKFFKTHTGESPSEFRRRMKLQ